MARFKPAKGKAKAPDGMPRQGLPCLVLVTLAIILTMVLMYSVLESS